MIAELNLHEVEPGITVCVFTGRLTLGNLMQSFQRTLMQRIDEGARKLVIDVTNLDFIDSAGIGMLLTCQGHINAGDGAMRVCGAQGSVARTFEIVHMDRIVTLDPDVESACKNILV